MPPERRVKSHLSDGDTHATGSLIAEPEDPLAVTDHDAFHVFVTCVTQNLVDTMLVRITEEQPTGLSPYFTEPLAALADGRRIYKRQHRFNIANQQRVKQCLVRILQLPKKAVLVERRHLFRQRPHSALNLFIKAAHMRRQKPVQPK